MNQDELRFIDRLFRDLYKDPQVQHQFINKKKDFKTKSHSTHKETDKYNIIDSYISTLELVHKRAMEKEWRIDYLKSLYHNKYVIKKEDIPDSYYKNQERLALERGFGHRVLLEEEKERMQQEIIDNQTSSLDVWLDYFLSEDAKFYPFWAKYWAFQGMLKLGSYDKTKRAFNKRTKDTVSPFADLNREALAKSIDLIIKYVGKEEIEEKELEVIVKRDSFQTVYPYVLEYILKNNNSSIKRNEGKWIKYNQGSDHMPLVKSLQGYNTGWCTAGESTARSQLQGGDFYVYYTLDENNEYKVPRIAIRMERGRIGEIRGIAKDQNIEPEMEEIVDDKIKDFPDKEKYYKKVSDMKKLTEIYYKHKNKAELTVEELRFLYEIDSKIEGFGYDKDSRIKEIIDERGKAREDLAKVLNCNTSQIAFSKKELKNDTIYYYGSIDLSGKTNGKGITLPQYIRENLYLGNLKSAEGLTLPQNVGGYLDLSSLKSAEDLTLPQNVGGDLYLSSLKSAEGLTLPQNVGGDLYLGSLESAEGLTLPQNVGGHLDLSSLESAEGLVLPESIGHYLNLESLESAKDLTLPQKVGGKLYLSSLKSAEGLVLPESVGVDLFLNNLESTEGLIFPEPLTYTIYCNGFKITPENVDNYRKKTSTK